MSGEHGIDADGKYVGNEELELQRINVENQRILKRIQRGKGHYNRSQVLIH